MPSQQPLIPISFLFLLLLLLLSSTTTPPILCQQQTYYITDTGFSSPLQQPNGITYFSGGLIVALNGTSRIVYYNLASPGSPPIDVAGTGYAGMGGENQLPTSSPLNSPTIAKFSNTGILYIADYANDRIRKIVPGGNVISTVNSSIALQKPYGLDIHPISGDLYISERSSRLVRLSPDTGNATELTSNVTGYNGDGIPAWQAQVNSPLHIHVKSNGVYYFIDYGNNAVRKVDVNGTISTVLMGVQYTAIGGNPNLSDEFYFGNVGGVFKYSNGSLIRIAGGGASSFSNGVSATSISIPSSVNGIDVGPSGEVYFSEFDTGKIRKLIPCSNGSVYSNISNGCVSCLFGATSLPQFCSGRGQCISENVCNCTVDGYYGPDCSLDLTPFNVSINSPSLVVPITDSTVVYIQLVSLAYNPHYFIWNCLDCVYKNSSTIVFNNVSDTLPIDGSLLNVGTYSFSVYAIGSYGIAYPYKVSNIVNFQVVISQTQQPEQPSVSPLEIYGLPTVVVDTNSSSSNSLNIIISKLSLGQSQLNQFLNCSSMSPTGSCEVFISYTGSIYLKDLSSSTQLISSYTGFTVASTNFNNTMTFSPPLNIKDSHSYSGSELIIQLLLIGPTSNLNFSSSVPILSAATPPTPSSSIGGGIIVDSLGTISPASGVALSDSFTISFSAWNASSQLLPLKYSIGFKDSKTSNLVRITEYSASTVVNFILPYISNSSSSSTTTPTPTRRSMRETVAAATSPVTIVVFVIDSLGNEYYSTVGSIVSVSPYTGSSASMTSLISAYASSPLLSVFSYDKSLSMSSATANSSDVTLEIIKNVVIDPKNPTTALTALQEATLSPESIDSRVVAELSRKINNFISSLNTAYRDDRAQFGFVKSKLSNHDTTSTTSIISNVLASGRGNDPSKGMADNLTGLLILGEVPTLIAASASQQQQASAAGNQQELSKISFTASNLDISFSVFQMEKGAVNETTSHVMNGGGDGNVENSVRMILSEIMNQYNGYSKESATSMVTYNSNIYEMSTSNGSVLTSKLTDFKYYQSQQVVTLFNLTSDIVLTFKITNSTQVMEKIMEYYNNSSSSSSNSSTIQSYNNSSSSSPMPTLACKYWDEAKLIWSSQGCYLKNLNLTLREIQCSCSHTTMFTTFVEQNTTTIAPLLRETVAAFYYGQIALGIFYFITAIVILCLLIIFKNEQPISSRLMTPYLGMIALIVESLLIYITQRGILVRQLTLGSTTTQMWESGDTDANTIANIVLIFANTINLTAILSYVMQVLRFQVMKYLYDLLASSRTNEKKSDQIIQVLRFLTSSSLFSAILMAFAVVNVCYWILWVVLRRTGVLLPATYTYIVSISYTVVILMFGAIITCVAVFDWAGSTIKRGIKSNRAASSLHNTRDAKFQATTDEKTKSKLQKFDPLQKIYNLLVGIDEPLYFRTEMIIYVISFIFLILNQVIGLVGNEYRYGNEASYKKALTFDTISFIFEVLYVFTYLFVFGGYSLILLLVSKIKIWKRNRKMNNSSKSTKNTTKSTANNKQKDKDINPEMTLALSNDECSEMFASFCVKEFSSENFYLYSDLKENSSIIECNSESIPKLSPYLNYIHDTYMKDGANYQVNIPSKCRNSFMKIFNKYASSINEFLDGKESSEVKSSFEMLIQQVFVNLGDTFSRFVFTVEFKIFKKTHELQQEMLEEANVVLIEESPHEIQ